MVVLVVYVAFVCLPACLLFVSNWWWLRDSRCAKVLQCAFHDYVLCLMPVLVYVALFVVVLCVCLCFKWVVVALCELF